MGTFPQLRVMTRCATGRCPAQGHDCTLCGGRLQMLTDKAQVHAEPVGLVETPTFGRMPRSSASAESAQAVVCECSELRRVDDECSL